MLLKLTAAGLVPAAVAKEAAARASAASGTLPPDSAALPEASIAELQVAMQRGARTAASITQDYLARIAALDRAGPTLNAIIELNPDAMVIAEALDHERREKGARGPLHGIPVLVKDNVDECRFAGAR